MKVSLFIIAAIGLSSCATRFGSGAVDAHKDISAGHIQLMEAGTFAVYAPGIKYGDHRFDGIPRHRLPNGCTNPSATDYIRYAEDYNAVVVDYIAKHGNLTH